MDSWQTTTLLLDRLRDLDEDAWTSFSGRFRPPITHFARKLGLPEHAAEDLAQDTLAAFSRAYKEGRFDRTKGRLRAWLFGIAHKEAMRHQRESVRHPRQGPANTSGQTTFFSGVPDERTMKATWDEQWERSVLEQCLTHARTEFSPSTFQAFELTALREVPPDQVAAQLGMSRSNVYLAKHRVLSRLGELQDQFESVGDTP